MIYAQIHTYNGNQQTIATRTDQPNTSWVGYNVPNSDWLSISGGQIVVATTDPAIAKQQAVALAAFQQSAKDAILSAQGTFDRIAEAVLTGKVMATDVTVQAWYAWRTATRSCITATTVVALPVRPAYYPQGT